MTLDEAIKHAEEVAEENRNDVDEDILDLLYCGDTKCIEAYKSNCIACAEEHEQLAKWLKKLKEIKRILDAPSYEENGVTYSYCYDSDTKLKHIREVVKND